MDLDPGELIPEASCQRRSRLDKPGGEGLPVADPSLVLAEVVSNVLPATPPEKPSGMVEQSLARWSPADLASVLFDCKSMLRGVFSRH